MARQRNASSVLRRQVAGTRGAPAGAVSGGSVGSGGTSGAKAELVTSMAGTNNDIRIRAQEAGTGGNAITFSIVDPPGNNVALSVAVAGTALTVTAATDGASAITSTAAQVIQAIRNHAEGRNLVEVSLPSGNDGTGVVTAVAATPLAGGVAPT